MTERVERLIKQMKLKRAAENAGLPRFECVCGNELWASEDARIICQKCFGAFRLVPAQTTEPIP